MRTSTFSTLFLAAVAPAAAAEQVRLEAGPLPVTLTDGVNTIEFACAPYDAGSQNGPWTKLWIDATSTEPFQVTINSFPESGVLPPNTDLADLITSTSPHGGSSPAPYSQQIELSVMAASKMVFILPGSTVTYDHPSLSEGTWCLLDLNVLMKDLEEKRIYPNRGSRR